MLRLLLNGHSELHAPHELHLRRLKVAEWRPVVEAAMRESGLDRTELDHLLWDRLLHRHLEEAGKSRIVEKTPSNVLMWRRLAQCWPAARFIFLTRHPWATALSWHDAKRKTGMTFDEAVSFTLRYMKAVEAARQALPGLTVRYEDVVVDPARETRRICTYLGVQWEPGMLDYGRHHNGRFVRGLGDWSSKIRSGAVQPPRPLPAGPVPERLRELCEAWGYTTSD